MNKDNVSKNSNENTGKTISVIKKEVANPYKYYNISRENLIPLLIGVVVAIFISLVGVFLYALLTKSYMAIQNTIIFAIIILFLILITLVIIQNAKHDIWEKDKLIKNLRSDFDVKDNTIRDLKGKVSELENKMNSLKEQLGECVEEKNKKIEEILKLYEEKKELTSEIKNLKNGLSKLTTERNNLKTEMERVKEELRTCTSVKKSYEEKVKPYIELKSFITVERGKILGILKVDDIYNISFENKGYAPAFNIEGRVVYFPVRGKSILFPISIAKLLPNENLPIPLGGKKTLKDCSKITVDIRYKDIIGNIHPLKEEMPYM